MTFLVDVNLPRFFTKIEKGNFVFVYDIDQELSDSSVWEMALSNGYTILTRDMEFYHRAKESIEFPKIIIVRFGNLKLNEMKEYFFQYWNNIYNLIKEHSLIFTWKNELEIVY